MAVTVDVALAVAVDVAVALALAQAVGFISVSAIICPTRQEIKLSPVGPIFI